MARWEQLEADPELAGPWHLLFEQVQSPRHVLSELLQNADDAGATSARAEIIDGHFLFSHNGSDFTERQFASLCRFGFSEKRNLHTIGFRGIGFKSTFSLGQPVQLMTPTLATAFHRDRFTAPTWQSNAPVVDETVIQVAIQDSRLEAELLACFDQWQANPASLLFFKHVNTLTLGSSVIEWSNPSPGPTPNSAWWTLQEGEHPPHLLFTSDEEPFPPDAQAEIKNTRLLAQSEEYELPPCRVELVLGPEGRLFVVLPTAVETNLPFACNAPFLQEPDRKQIKDPATSPTNRWLLERVGRLAAGAMLAWLAAEDIPPEQRAQAYDLMPVADRSDTSLQGLCSAIVVDAFDSAISHNPYVLADINKLVPAGQCLSVPTALMGVWSSKELLRLLGNDSNLLVSRHCSPANLQKLADRREIIPVSRSSVVVRLKSVTPTKPQSWRQLLTLWSYLFDDLPPFEWANNSLRGLHIVPVQGQSVLFPAGEVTPLSEKRLLTSDDDWAFLSVRLKAYNRNWCKFLAEQRLLAERQSDMSAANLVERAYELQSHLKLTESSDLNQVMRKVADAFFMNNQVPISDCVRLAQIAARLGATVGPEFRFVTKDRRLTHTLTNVVADESGAVAAIVPEAWAELHLLHDRYWQDWTSCSREEWSAWIDSGKASLVRFPAPKLSPQTFWLKTEFDLVLSSHGFAGTYETPYKTQHFELNDFDFEQSLWEHWNWLASNDQSFWARLVGSILAGGPAFWIKSVSSDAFHFRTDGKVKQKIISSGVSSSWISRLRDLPCLFDRKGIPRKPLDLMRRSAATEPLLDVEHSLPVDVDTEANRPILNALGVRSTPTGPKQILERIRALAETDSPPIAEVEKWYRRLDDLFLSCTSEQTREIRELFVSEALILSASHGWVRSQEVFISATADDVPDTPLIRSSVQDLELWGRIHVAPRPNAELILQWLRELPKGEPLSSDLAKRVKPNLARLGVAAWEQCGRWLNLSNEWVPTTDLKYSVSMRSLTKTHELFPAVKRATADFQMLDFETLGRYPFADVPALASCLEEQVSGNAVQSFVKHEKLWLECLAKNLARIEVPSEVDQARLHEAAIRLAQTEWRQGVGLETVPYLDGMPVGPARRVPAVWSGLTLYVAEASFAQQAAPVAREIVRCFDLLSQSNALKSSLIEAIGFCSERANTDIVEYLEQEFTLGSALFATPEKPAEATTAVLIRPVEGQPVSEAPTEETPKPAEDQEPSKQQQAPVGEHPTPPAPEPNRTHQQRDSNRPDKPSLVERYAATMGLRSDGNGKFIGPTGTVLLRSAEGMFPWEFREGTTSSMRLLPLDHCLEREPITLDAEVWSLLTGAPEACALLVLAPNGAPLLLTGRELAEGLGDGSFGIYPARCRITKTRVKTTSTSSWEARNLDS